MPNTDAALERFDELHWKLVRGNAYTFANCLAEFQTTAAGLAANERIKLYVSNDVRENTAKLFNMLLLDKQASKICWLEWYYSDSEDVFPIAELLTSNCPELASLQVYHKHQPALDFVSSVLEHPNARDKVKVLSFPCDAKGDVARFFAALGQSQVSEVDFDYCSYPEFSRGLFAYLAKDLLVRLQVTVTEALPVSELMASLATCTRLTKLAFYDGSFSNAPAFTLPRSVTRLKFTSCHFYNADWSFLEDCNVQQLTFDGANGLGEDLPHALADHVRRKGLEELCLQRGDLCVSVLTATGVGIGRIKRLIVKSHGLDTALVKLIAQALQAPDNELRELTLTYNENTVAGVKAYLGPALRHPNCNLTRLELEAPFYGVDMKPLIEVRIEFAKRRALLALLQGQQIRRLQSPLRRLPVEMLRLVAQHV